MDPPPSSSLVDVMRLVAENKAAIQEVQALLEDLLLRQTSLSAAQRVLEEEVVLKSLIKLGMDMGDAWPPITSLIIHRCVTHWRSFATPDSHGNQPVQLSSFLESILSIIEREGRVAQEDEEVKEQPPLSYRRHSYWLASSLTLLLLFPPSATKSNELTLADRLKGMYDSVQARSFVDPSPQKSNEEKRREMFRSRTEKAAMSAYSLILLDLKKELAGIIPSCVQILPQSDLPSPSFAPPSSSFVKRSAWIDLIDAIDICIRALRQQGLDPMISDLVLAQALSMIDVQLFNQLLLRPECCFLSNARFQMEGIRDLDKHLLIKPIPGTTDKVRPPPSHLRHSRQALAFLCHMNKAAITIRELRECICPDLTAQQLYRLATVCLDDVGDGCGMVEGEILEDLKGSTSSNTSMGNGGLIVTFLLDEERVPGLSKGETLSDVLSSMSSQNHSSLLKGFEAPPQLLSIPGVCREPFDFFLRDLTIV